MFWSTDNGNITFYFYILNKIVCVCVYSHKCV